MDRREFLGAAAAVTAAAAYGSVAPLPRRPYKNGIDLSIIAFGGIVVCGLSPEEASRRVHCDRLTKEVIRLRRVLAEQKSSTDWTRSGGAIR